MRKTACQQDAAPRRTLRLHPFRRSPDVRQPPDGPATIHGASGITLPAPPVATVDVVTDDYAGTKIEDPYRWLENAKSPETRAWIDKENAYTQQYLSQITTLPQISSQLTSLMRVDQYSMPTLRGSKYFFKKRLADENQCSIYMRTGRHGDESLINATKSQCRPEHLRQYRRRLRRRRSSGLRNSRRRRR